MNDLFVNLADFLGINFNDENATDRVTNPVNKAEKIFESSKHSKDQRSLCWTLRFPKCFPSYR